MKNAENCVFPVHIFQVQKGHNSYKNCRKLMTLKLALKVIKGNSHKQLQLNMLRHVREKCGKLCISSILSSKRDMTPTKMYVY